MHRPKNILTMTVFIGFLLIVLGYLHYFVYYSLTRYIDVSAKENIWLAIIL